jgi:hypothetical protein
MLRYAGGHREPIALQRRPPARRFARARPMQHRRWTRPLWASTPRSALRWLAPEQQPIDHLSRAPHVALARPGHPRASTAVREVQRGRSGPLRPVRIRDGKRHSCDSQGDRGVRFPSPAPPQRPRPGALPQAGTLTVWISRKLSHAISGGRGHLPSHRPGLRRGSHSPLGRPDSTASVIARSAAGVVC